MQSATVSIKRGRSLGMAWQLSLDVADLWGQSGDGMTPNNLLNKKKEPAADSYAGKLPHIY